ncbi:hypothetical protein RJT34_20027 [Clitoria ternatea]|uniref:Uncharacterized protein n=1 Tax=Clitoria ternatea TaxID=43366 RepID=A0AAN9IS63_CLITE
MLLQNCKQSIQSSYFCLVHIRRSCNQLANALTKLVVVYVNNVWIDRSYAGEGAESTYHIFFQCKHSYDLWMRYMRWLGF